MTASGVNMRKKREKVIAKTKSIIKIVHCFNGYWLLITCEEKFNDISDDCIRLSAFEHKVLIEQTVSVKWWGEQHLSVTSFSKKNHFFMLIRAAQHESFFRWMKPLKVIIKWRYFYVILIIGFDDFRISFTSCFEVSSQLRLSIFCKFLPQDSSRLQIFSCSKSELF